MPTNDRAGAPFPIPIPGASFTEQGWPERNREYFEALFSEYNVFTGTTGPPPVAPPVAPAPAIPLPRPAPPPQLPAPVAPPAPLPAPLPPPIPMTPGPPSGGLSEESLRSAPERAMRDTATRQGAQPRPPFGLRGPIREGEILRPPQLPSSVWGIVGRAIAGAAGVLFPSRADAPGLTPEQRREGEERWIDEFGRDMARGGGIAIGGITLGGMVVLDELGRTPIPVPELGEPRVRVEVPRVSIPAPSIPQPTVHSGVPQVTPSIPPPLPQPVAKRATGQKRPPKTRQATRSTPRPTVSTPNFPVLDVLTRVATQALLSRRTRSSSTTRTRSSSTTRTLAPTSTPTVSTPILSTPTVAPTLPAPTVSAPPIVQTPTGLTNFQPQVVGSSPPRSRTPTQNDQCKCQQRRRAQKRKCRARAPVVWGGGPRKGQAAGTRCISFER